MVHFQAARRFTLCITQHPKQTNMQVEITITLQKLGMHQHDGLSNTCLVEGDARNSEVLKERVEFTHQPLKTVTPHIITGILEMGHRIIELTKKLKLLVNYPLKQLAKCCYPVTRIAITSSCLLAHPNLHHRMHFSNVLTSNQDNPLDKNLIYVDTKY